jgi:hypothetical protein
MLFSILVFGILISCQREEDPIVVPNPVVLPDLYLTWPLDSIPVDTLSQYPIAVYVNSFEDERFFQILFEKDIGAHVKNNIRYPYEVLLIQYIDLTSNYSMFIYAYTGYTDSLHHAESLIVEIPHLTPGDKESKIYFPADFFAAHNRYFPEMEILGHPFQKVHSNELGPPVTDYGEIYYTTSQGIIGFRGENGEYWRFKRWK